MLSKRRGNEMHRKLAIFTVLAVLGVIGAGSAVAGQPTEPGCFGEDRSTNIHALQTERRPGRFQMGRSCRRPRRDERRSEPGLEGLVRR